MKVIRAELIAIRDQYADPRRSEIVARSDRSDPGGSDQPRRTWWSPCPTRGYVKAQPISDYQAQRRGGKGKSGDHLQGRGLHRQALRRQLPRHRAVLLQPRSGLLAQGLRAAPGRARRPWPAHGQPAAAGARASASTPCCRCAPTRQGYYVFMATSTGTVKKTPLTEFSRPLSRGIIAIEPGGRRHTSSASTSPTASRS